MLHEQIGQYPQQGLGSKLDHTYMAYNTLKRFAVEKRKETLCFQITFLPLTELLLLRVMLPP